MTKYKEYFKKMMDAEKEKFDIFRKTHDEYAINQDKLQDRYNNEGEKILEIIHDWENKLCMQSEKGGYGVFTTKLAEKFHEEIKKEFPLIDYIGLKIEKSEIIQEPSVEPAFAIKKIILR